jgi:hypothetical protein
MLPWDVAQFEDFLRTTGNIVLVASRSIGPQPTILRDDLRNVSEELSLIVLWNRSITPGLVMRRVDGVAHYFTVDRIRSEVVEFLPSRLFKGSLRRGRIWAEMIGHDENFLPEPKSVEFCRWYDSLARWIRRHARRINSTYTMSAAESWAKKGGELG